MFNLLSYFKLLAKDDLSFIEGMFFSYPFYLHNVALDISLGVYLSRSCSRIVALLYYIFSWNEVDYDGE